VVVRDYTAVELVVSVKVTEWFGRLYLGEICINVGPVVVKDCTAVEPVASAVELGWW